MHIGEKFGLGEALWWTRKDILRFLVISTVPVVLYTWLGWTWISIPWVPIALVGTAVAFMVGFKNNASYDRLWEARKIWGGIVNISRTWTILCKDFVTNQHATEPVDPAALHQLHKRLVHRHLAWITALRFQLRQERQWESMRKSSNREYSRAYHVEEKAEVLEDHLKKYLSEEECAVVLSKSNAATQIISNQSGDLRELMEMGFIEDFRHMELESLLGQMYELQGKSERIKNFPYPRQFATLNVFFVWLFVLLLPFGMLNEFQKLGGHFIWLTVPFSTLVSWVFHTMERIGEASENPFQGGPNDIPMTSLSRTIEIDLKEMLDEGNIPEPVEAYKNIVM